MFIQPVPDSYLLEFCNCKSLSSVVNVMNINMGSNRFHFHSVIFKRVQCKFGIISVESCYYRRVFTRSCTPSLLDPYQQMDEVTDELLKKITSSKTQPQARNFRVERNSAPAIPLTFDSSPAEVTAWLQSKYFSKPWVCLLLHLGLFDCLWVIYEELFFDVMTVCMNLCVCFRETLSQDGGLFGNSEWCSVVFPK